MPIASRWMRRSRSASVPAPSEPAGLDDALQKSAGALVAWIAEHPLGRALLMHDTFIKEADFRCDLAGKAHLVSGEQHGHALRSKVAHDTEHFRDQPRFECRGD